MIEDHIELVRESTINLQKMVDSVYKGEIDNRSLHYKNLDQSEYDADLLRARIGDEVSKSDMFPEERIDIVDILSSSDMIADYSKEAGGIINVLKLDRAPKELREVVLEMIKANVESASVLEKCIKILPKDPTEAMKIASEVEKYEEKVDKLFASSRLYLADLDFPGWSIGSMILLTEFLKVLEAASDNCEITMWVIRAIALRL